MGRLTIAALAGSLLLIGATSQAASSPPGGLSLNANRDRLLDTMAAYRGAANRCAVWSTMGTNQRGVFLTITAMLQAGYMYWPPYRYYLNTSSAQGHCSECSYPNVGCSYGADCTNNYCFVYAPIYAGGPSYCRTTSYESDSQAGLLTKVAQPRTGWLNETMLDHVSQLYSMAANTSSCGGADNRMYFSADDTLIDALRNLSKLEPTGWGNSSDLMGPHDPFTQSRESVRGQPRGQSHQFAWDSEVVWVQKSGMASAVYDPHLVEMDIDYNFWHDSNPECFYGGVYGRTLFSQVWPGNLTYQPTCP